MSNSICVGNAGGFGDEGGLVFITLPELESQADANNFICEFTGGAASNETGVGAGLVGADLVFTQTGAIAAASSGWRNLSGGTQQGFKITVPWYNNFITNASGFSFLWHVRNIDTTLGTNLAFLDGGIDELNFAETLLKIISPNAILMTAGLGLGGAYPSADEAYVLFSVDFVNDFCFMGIAPGSSQPTKVSDFFTTMYSDAIQNMSAGVGAWAVSREAIVGDSSAANAADFDIKSMTAALYPSVSKI